jgi:hypothetical protein
MVEEPDNLVWKFESMLPEFPPITPLRWAAIGLSLIMVVCAASRLLVDMGGVSSPFVRAMCLPPGVILAFGICITALGVRMGWYKR